MAAILKPKRTTTASKVPTTADLADGEFCINVTDKKGYIRSGTTIVQFSVAGTSLADYGIGDAALDTNVVHKVGGVAESINGYKTFTGGVAIQSSMVVGGAVAGAVGIELGNTNGVAATAYLDFHSGATVADYDARISSTGGDGTAGNGTLTVAAATLAVTGTVTSGSDQLGYLGVKYAAKTAAYTFTTADRDKGAAKNTATAITFTLPTSPTAGDVYPFANINATGNLTIAPGTGGTLRLAGTATSGNRTVAPWGMGSATCVVGGASPVWLCAGAGVS